MDGFVVASRAYRTNQNCPEASIEDVGSIPRDPLFRDSEEGSAHDRVIRVLRAFRLGDAIPPVEIVEGRAGYPHQYKLTHGVHRFYCSLAAGFTHVPWIKGFEWET